ncbi:SOSS complex subunit B homolog [Daktulosphaira vitifoliae]|uniref:SOSS complex subunit B homolog n=1 Tax=Daktulosphaira vitifoliae TaxID=58002 RepID=UPI0021AA60B6|nr:SOSS complex subunit B homolog [Daktulosphaira vitifoliae]
MMGINKPKSINPEISLTAIKDIQNNMNNITVVCIVLEVNPAVPLKDNHEVRTVKVADNSACINFSVWDEPGAFLYPGDIIRVHRAYAIYFRNCLTLYVGKNGEIEKIGDFIMTFNEAINMSEVNLNAPPPLPPPANGNTIGNTRRTGMGKQNVKQNSFKGNNGKGGPRNQLRPDRK